MTLPTQSPQPSGWPAQLPPREPAFAPAATDSAPPGAPNPPAFQPAPAGEAPVSPVTPGASPGRLRRRLRRFGGALLVVVAVAAGFAITETMPDTAERERPFVREGAVGQTVDARTFDVTVEEVRVASVLGVGRNRHQTQGVWVIVRVRFTATTEPTSIKYAALLDAQGRTFLATDRIAQQAVEGARELQPGVPIRAEVVFEAPAGALEGLSVQFADARDQRMGATAQVALGLAAGAWLDPAPATITLVEVL